MSGPTPSDCALAHLERAQRLSATGSWEWDIASGGLIWSDQIFRIFGHDPASFVPSYEAFLACIHPDDRDLVTTAVDRALEGEPYRIEHRVVRPCGEVRWVIEQGELMRGPDGQPAGMLGAVQDITDLRALQAAARRSQDMLSGMMAISPEAIVVTDATGRVEFFSTGAEALFGYSQREVVGQSVELLMPQAVRAAHQGHVERFARGDLSSLRMHDRAEILGLRRNGEAFPAEASLARLETPDGRYFAAIIRDLSDRRANERRLREAWEVAERASRSKSVFLANMSHEIRTPLNGVLGVAQALARTPLTSAQREMVQLIEVSGRALESLLGDILDLAKVDAGRMTMASEPFDLRALAHEVHALFRASAREKGVELRMELTAGCGGWFRGDALRIRQVLSNLLSNAVKFTRQGEIRLSIRVEQGEAGPIARFSVSDTGIGFDPDQAERLFERFEQADSSTTRSFGGTGLGLAISRSLVELMGGTISATGEAGRGATFSFQLPIQCADPPAGAEADGPGGPGGAAARRVRVLLAEDHPINRRVIELMLDPDLVDLESVENGEQAVDRCDARAFDLILMDMQMPVMDGLTAIGAIRAREAAQGRPRARIFTLTANALPEHRRASEEAGADGFLTKPVDARALLEAVFVEAEAAAEAAEA
ncbi:MAG: PAS domain S-box protein [Caulobacter sp.]|nr:PAS domain S-box protein [Caulobacter sp.]